MRTQFMRLRPAAAALALIAVTSLVVARPASAQIFRTGGVNPLVGAGVRGTAIGHDPNHGYYLVVGAHGTMNAVCMNASGQAVSAPFSVGSSLWEAFPRVQFSAQTPDGAGGAGAFLVSWVSQDGPSQFANAVHVRLVSCNPAVHNNITADTVLSDYAQDGAWADVGGSSIAYSTTSQRFLVVYQTADRGIQARFVDVNGNPLGGVMAIANPGGAQGPGVAWNPATDEFGISYVGWGGTACGGAPFAAFVRLSAAGALSGRTQFGCASGTFLADVAVNRNTNNYVMAWSLAVGMLFQEFTPGGVMTGNGGLLGANFGGNDSLTLSFNPISGTFLAAGQDHSSFELMGVEGNTNGYPTGGPQYLTSGSAAGNYYPRVSARSEAAQWGVSFAQNYALTASQIVGTSSSGGGPTSAAPTAPAPAPTNSGCSTPDPFVAMGGGVCINGGWYPPGSAPAPAPAPAPTPAPTPPPPPSGGCTTPNPFASMGAGVCVNGGWQFGSPAAPSAPTPAPAPTLPTAPSSGGCTTPNPFASMGMGLCVNGGWQFLPMAAPTPSGPVLCNGTPDPFTTSGGGTCINGGWVPNNSLPVLCSGLPDPFTAFGGGVCINGGWRMRNEDD
jgi:hypothetical protein